MSDPVQPEPRPARWMIVLAFALVYVSWGTTFFAIRAGVHSYHLPPALFSGLRVGLVGWVGLFVGLGGVFLLMAPELQQAHGVHELRGPLLILGSSACWSLGSVVLHHQRPSASHLAAAAYQMVLGGGGLALLGLAF